MDENGILGERIKVTQLKDRPMRAAAYCRVSTDKEDQANSLESQKKYFKRYIGENPNWTFCGIYADDGISGTDTKNREAFGRMIEDAREGKFDLIITKEISRFARNIVDSLVYTRELRKIGVGVLFLNDSVYTMDNDGELRIALMAAIAQEESRKTSERVKWGQRRQMEKGVVFGRDMLGYDVRDGRLIINEEGAETVRRIFHKFLDEGKGARRIAQELSKEGAGTSEYMKEWSYTNILRILRNEKYCGDLIQQKTYTPDYLTHCKKLNRGEREKVIIRNHHRGIISRERFEQAQRELERRSRVSGGERCMQSGYALSGKIVCGETGKVFIRRQRRKKDGSLSVSWVCGARRGGKDSLSRCVEGCGLFSVKEEEIRDMVMKAARETLEGREDKMEAVLKALESVTKCSEDEEGVLREKIRKCKIRKKRLVEMWSEGYIEKEEFLEIIGKAERERLELEKRLSETAKRGENLGRREEESFLRKAENFASEILRGGIWSDAFYGKLTERIEIFGSGRADIYLKYISGKWEALILKGRKEISQYKKDI